MALKLNLKACLDFFKKESAASPGKEIVGFLGIEKNGGKVVAKLGKNRSDIPFEAFLVDPVEYIKFVGEHDECVIFHSHPTSDCSFSLEDIENSENCCHPFVVYSLEQKKLNLYVPSTSEVSDEYIKILEEVLND